MFTDISNTDDIIDSRAVIERITELEEQIEELEENPEGLPATLDSEGELHDLRVELKALKALAAEGESLSDWEYGEALVHEDYFEDYARQLAEDLYGDDIRDAHWPFTYIDWERAADALMQDYTPIDFDGQTYYGRA